MNKTNVNVIPAAPVFSKEGSVDVTTQAALGIKWGDVVAEGILAFARKAGLAPINLVHGPQRLWPQSWILVHHKGVLVVLRGDNLPVSDEIHRPA